jgi:hypothetical protein
MTSEDKAAKGAERGVSRRNLLRAVGAGAGAAAAVGALSPASPAHADSETNDEKRKSRYRETDHVKTFYAVNRYPK